MFVLNISTVGMPSKYWNAVSNTPTRLAANPLHFQHFQHLARQGIDYKNTHQISRQQFINIWNTFFLEIERRSIAGLICVHQHLFDAVINANCVFVFTAQSTNIRGRWSIARKCLAGSSHCCHACSICGCIPVASHCVICVKCTPWQNLLF